VALSRLPVSFATTAAGSLAAVGLCLGIMNAGVAAGADTDIDAHPPVVLADTQDRAIVSSVDGHRYRLRLSVPETPPPADGYPVIYLLDAHAFFGTMRESVRLLSKRPKSTGVAPALVVGIMDPEESIQRRMRNFSLPAPDRSDAKTDGAAGFLRFLTKDVRPAIARDFRIDTERQSIFGHSLGGLFVLYTLFTAPDTFQGYAAASPAIWWQDSAILGFERAHLAGSRPGAAGLRLLMTAGEREQWPAPGSPDSARAEVLAGRRMVENAAEMADRLADAGLDASFAVFPDETHPSVVPAAVSRAVRFLSAAWPAGQSDDGPPLTKLQ